MIFSIDLYSTKHNTFILNCFIQFTCTNLDGCQKEEGNFLNLLQKEGGTQKGGGGSLRKKKGVGGWGSKPGGNYVLISCAINSSLQPLTINQDFIFSRCFKNSDLLEHIYPTNPQSLIVNNELFILIRMRQ